MIKKQFHPTSQCFVLTVLIIGAYLLPYIIIRSVSPLSIIGTLVLTTTVNSKGEAFQIVLDESTTPKIEVDQSAAPMKLFSFLFLYLPGKIDFLLTGKYVVLSD